MSAPENTAAPALLTAIHAVTFGAGTVLPGQTFAADPAEVAGLVERGWIVLAADETGDGKAAAPEKTNGRKK